MSVVVWLITAVQVLSGVAIIGVVLLQQGKGSSMSAAFGTGGSQTFGARTDEVITKATTWCAGIFLVTSLVLSLLSGRTGSIVQQAGQVGDNLPGLQSLAEQSPPAAASSETAAGE